MREEDSGYLRRLHLCPSDTSYAESRKVAECLALTGSA